MQRELLLEDLQLLAGDATLSSLTFVLNLTFPPVEWMLNREAQELVYKNAHHMATQKSRQPPQTTSIHQTISTSQLTNPNLSKPQANHTLTPISPFPFFPCPPYVADPKPAWHRCRQRKALGHCVRAVLSAHRSAAGPTPNYLALVLRNS